MATVECFLSPEELLVVAHGGMAYAAAYTTCTHEGYLRMLRRSTIFLGEICTLQSGVARSRREFLKFEFMYATGRNEGQKGYPGSEDHGWF
jgi:hypothetical protein